VTRWLTVADAQGRLCLQRIVKRPGANSAVVHYKVLSDRAVLRKVVRIRELPDPDDVRRVVREQVPLESFILTLDPATCPKCRQRSCVHLRHAVEALALLREREEDRIPVALWPVDILPGTEEAHAVEDRSEDQPYDGGWEPGGIGWFDDRNHPQARIKIPWATDAPAVPSATPPLSRFLRDIAGDDTGGATAVLAPIAERVLSRTVTYLPRLAGGWDDLFQHGMAVALPEARALSPSPGESLDDFAVRLERRVATAVRHRLIDLIRRQDAADRNTASISIEEVRERGVEETGSEVDPFDLVFQPHLSARRDARARAIALAVYRQSTGLARRIIRRAYLTAFVGRSTPGTLELRGHPDYPAAAQALAIAWAEGLAQSMAGAVTPVYDRPRAKRRARHSAAGAA
jgi:hypothetical protein